MSSLITRLGRKPRIYRSARSISALTTRQLGVISNSLEIYCGGHVFVRGSYFVEARYFAFEGQFPFGNVICRLSKTSGATFCDACLFAALGQARIPDTRQ